MKSFDSRIGALVLALLGAGYFMVATVTGHNAASEPPMDLRPLAGEAGLDPMKAAALLVEQPRTVVLDVRPEQEFALYHVPGAESAPGGTASLVAERANGGTAVLVVASTDEQALALVDGARHEAPGRAVHYLKDGTRGYYLAFELPVGLFSDAPAPRGYDTSMETVRQYLSNRLAGDGKAAAAALAVVARSGYHPTLLKGGAAPRAGGSQKKITGGCG